MTKTLTAFPVCPAPSLPNPSTFVWTCSAEEIALENARAELYELSGMWARRNGYETKAPKEFGER